MRVVSIVLLVLLASLAGCAADDAPSGLAGSTTSPPATSASASTTSTTAVDCRIHRHATFAVFVPGNGSDGMRRIDLGAPKDAQGRPYYQLGIAPNMTVAIHMHQQGAEVGSAELAASQMHYESSGVCGTFAGSLRAVDMAADGSGLTIGGRHASVGQAGHWANNATHQVHLYTRPVAEECAWSEVSLSTLDGAVADGISFLVAFGAPTPAQVTEMQAAVPEPMAHETCGDNE